MIITAVWKDQPGDFFCVSSKDHSGKWQDHFFKRSELRKVKTFINDNLDKDLYWCPHGFSQPRRLKEYAKMPSLLWADLDEADPSKITPMPTIAWQSSHGRYVGLWLTTETVNEDLNRRLTYAIDADHGGWDVTQVLRIPGTNNYKYHDAPRVKLLWSDGPTYELDEIEGVLPKEELPDAHMGEAIKIYKRYERRLSTFVRRELMNGKPKAGKRSEVLWRLNREMLEVGMSIDEAFVLLANSPWNKFRGRRNGDKQLRRELEKSVGKQFESPEIPHKEESPYRFLTTSLADVEEEQLDWIWYPYLARRELTILEGDPGLGKSYLAQMIGAHLVDGKKLPCVKVMKPIKGKVAYFDLENSVGTVTKARLVDNGCKNLKDYFQDERPFMIDDEDALENVYAALERVKPDLVVFDTLNTYIGKADVHKASDTQQAMVHFVEIAKRFNCSVVVLRHLTKSTKERALYRGQGSIAFAGMARVVITVGEHPDEPNIRVMSVTKINVTKRPQALTFEIRGLPDTLKRQDRSKFEWGEFVDLTSDDITSTAPAIRENRTDEIRDFLTEVLSEGPVLASKVSRIAESRGIGYKILLRVAEEIGVVRKQSGFGKTKISHWALANSVHGKNGDNHDDSDK